MAKNETLVDKVKVLETAVSYNMKVAGKILAMSSYKALMNYSGKISGEYESKEYELSAIISTLEEQIGILHSGKRSSDASRELRISIGEIKDEPGYEGTSVLFPLMHSFAVHTPLHGNNFREMGLGLYESLYNVVHVNGESYSERMARQYNAVHDYLMQKITPKRTIKNLSIKN